MMKSMIITLIWTALAINNYAIAEPYADKIKVSSKISEFGKMMIVGSKVPDKSSVPIPPYPNAVVLQTSDAGQMQFNGKNGLAYIKLLTSDDINKVVAWYKKQLPTYFYQKKGFMDMFIHTFWEKEGDYNLFDMEARSLNMNVSISDGAIHKDDFPETQSMIEISYKSK